MSSRQRNFSRQISNSPSCARTNGYESEKFGFFDGGTTSLQVNTDCASTTTSTAPSPKGGASGRRRRPQGRSRAPNGDRDEAPRGYCWGHHLRSDRRRHAKTSSQGRAEGLPVEGDPSSRVFGSGTEDDAPGRLKLTPAAIAEVFRLRCSTSKKTERSEDLVTRVSQST